MSDEIIEENKTPKVAEPEIATEPEVFTPPVVVDEPVTTPIEPAPIENTPEIPIENKTEEVATPVELTPEPIQEIKMEEPVPEPNSSSNDGEPSATEPINEDKIIRSFLLKMLGKANLATKARNQKRLETLIAFFDTNPKVTNNMVEKLLKVSDSTATMYLKKLKNQGKIIQHGEHGSRIFYTKA